MALPLPPPSAFFNDLDGEDDGRALNSLHDWYVAHVGSHMHVNGNLDGAPVSLRVKSSADASTLVVEDGRSISLVGALDAALAAMHGMPLSAIGAFKQGFPRDWANAWPPPPPPPPPPHRRSKRLEPPAAEAADVRRSTRLKAVPEEPCYDEDELLLREISKRERRNASVNLFSDEDDDEDDDNDGRDEHRDWSKSERARLQNASLEYDPTQADYWDRVAEAVSGRTAEECHAMWTALARVSKQTKRAGKEPAKDQAPARAGTARFRREVRTTWQRVMLGGEVDDDGLLDCTPLRRAGAVPPEQQLAAGLNDTLRAALAQVQTPAVTFNFGNAGDGAAAGDDDDDAARPARPSPYVLVDVDRNTLDAYLAGMVKQNKRRAHANEVKRAQKVLKATPLKPSEVRAMQVEGVSATQTPSGTVRLMVEFDIDNPEEEEEEEEDRDV